MYKCQVCKQQIQLTEEQNNAIIEGEEINVKCNCGFFNIMVGAEYVENGCYNNGEPYYEIYSYDVK